MQQFEANERGFTIESRPRRTRSAPQHLAPKPGPAPTESVPGPTSLTGSEQRLQTPVMRPR